MPGEQNTSFYEKSLEINAPLSKGGSCRPYYYHEAFPEVEFYAEAPGALEHIQKMVNLMTVDRLNNPLAKHVQEALTLHGKLHIRLMRHSNFIGQWCAAAKTLSLSDILFNNPTRLMDTFVFELCNATNAAVNRLRYDAFEDSNDYAQKAEEAESCTHNCTVLLSQALGFPNPGEIEEIKTFMEISHSIKGLKALDGLSHFDRNVSRHNEHLISKMETKLLAFRLTRGFCSFMTLGWKSNKTSNGLGDLNHKSYRLIEGLQEKYAFREALKQKARENLQECPYTEAETVDKLSAEVEAMYTKYQQDMDRLQAEIADLQKKMGVPHDVLGEMTPAALSLRSLTATQRVPTEEASSNSTLTLRKRTG